MINWRAYTLMSSLKCFVFARLVCVYSVIDHRRRQNVLRTSTAHSAIASCTMFLFLPHFDVISDQLLN